MSDRRFAPAARFAAGALPPLRLRWVALFAIVAVAAGVTAWLLGRQSVAPAPHRHVASRSATASGLTTVKAPDGRFTIGYPSSWRRDQSADPQVVLLATGPSGASLLVRESQLSAPVTSANLAAAKKLADGVVRSGTGVSMLRAPQAVTLGGLPGYLYLYTFEDPNTGERGAHAHYFLFMGRTMITLVFQAVPAASILSLDTAFDRIAATFHAGSG